MNLVETFLQPTGRFAKKTFHEVFASIHEHFANVQLHITLQAYAYDFLLPAVSMYVAIYVIDSNDSMQSISYQASNLLFQKSKKFHWILSYYLNDILRHSLQLLHQKLHNNCYLE